MNGMGTADAHARLARVIEEARSLLGAFERLLAEPRASLVAARAEAAAAEVGAEDESRWPGAGDDSAGGPALPAAAERALRFRVARWKEEAGPLLEAVGRILEESAELRAGAVAAARERERLRGEIHRLRSEGQQARKAIQDVQRLLDQVLPRLGGNRPPEPPSSSRG